MAEVASLAADLSAVEPAVERKTVVAVVVWIDRTSLWAADSVNTAAVVVAAAVAEAVTSFAWLG